MRTRPHHLWILIALLGLAVGLRLVNIQSQSLWFDEAWSAYAANQPDIVQAAAGDATNPPLYYMLLHVSTQFWGDSVFALRLFSLFWGILLIPLGYQLARRLFSPRAGLFAAFLLTFSPLLWWAAQEARMYTFLAALVLIAAIGWHQLRHRPSRQAWALVLGAELALLYSHNTGPVIPLWLNLVTLVVWLQGQKNPPVRQWIGGQVLVGLLWLPYFIGRFLQLTAANSAVNDGPEYGLALFSAIWQSFWAGSWEMVNQEPVLMALSGVALILWLAVTPWGKVNVRWLVGHGLVLLLGLLLGLSVLGNGLHSRYLVLLLPLLLIPLGAGMARLSRVFQWGVSVFFVGLFALSWHYAQNPAWQHDDVRGMVQYYADNLTAEDSVLAWSYADRYDLAYYWDRLGVTARRITLPEGADLEAIAPLLPDSGKVALNVWYTQRADYRGMMGCVLEHGAVQRPIEHNGFGMTSYVYQQAPAELPQTQAFTGAILDSGGGALGQVSAVGTLLLFDADQALCLPVTLTLESASNGDMSAAILVKNSLGNIVTQVDAVFATANQRQSSALKAGESLTAYPLIRLPYGAPAGAYQVFLRVYDSEAQLSGYDLQRDGLTQKDLPLGFWEVTAGEWRFIYSSAVPMDLIEHPGGGRLVAHDASSGVLKAGEVLKLELYWQEVETLPDLILQSETGSWSVVIPAHVEPIRRDNYLTLDWRQVSLPADVPSGAMVLRFVDGPVLAEYTIDNFPFLHEAPIVGEAIDVAIPGVGRLVGYDLPTHAIRRPEDIHLTLVWQAGELPISESYTVFAQLLDTEGRLIAQSDSIPAEGTRPTTGWRSGEYIIDRHSLSFNTQAQAGPAQLIVGFYVADTFARLETATGGDYIPLPTGVHVE